MSFDALPYIKRFIITAKAMQNAKAWGLLVFSWLHETQYSTMVLEGRLSPACSGVNIQVICCAGVYLAKVERQVRTRGP